MALFVKIAFDFVYLAVAGFIATYGVAIAANIAASYVLGQIFKPKDPDQVAALSGRTISFPSSVASRKTVYGRVMKGGTITYRNTTGKKNKLLHVIVTLATHEIQEIEAVYLNDVDITDDRYKHLILTSTGIAVGSSGTPVRITNTSKSFGNGDPSIATHRDVLKVSGSTSSDGWYEIMDTKDADIKNSFYRVIRLDGDMGIEAAGANISLYRQHADVIYHLGQSGQVADATLIGHDSNWTSAHVGNAIAYIYVILAFNPKVFTGGIPNIKALIKGKKILDSRTSTTAYSANWALCVRDYLTSAEGLNAAAGEIDDTSFNAAANASDDNVPLPPAGATTEKRYECNGVVDHARTPKPILSSMLAAGAGTLAYINGKWHLNAGVYQTPTVTLDEDNLRGRVSVTAKTPRKDLFNAVGGVYVDPLRDWQPTDFAPVTNSTYETEDGGERITKDVAFEFTTSEYAAQRIGKLFLERARQGIIVEYQANLSALNLIPGDSISLTLDHFGWSAKVFRILTWNLAGNLGIDLTLQEEASGVYTWAYGEATELDLAPNTDLPSPFQVPKPESITLTSGDAEATIGGDGTYLPRVKVAWTPPNNAFIVGYRIRWRIVGADKYTIFIDPHPPSWITGVADGTNIEAGVQAINSIGRVSDWLDFGAYVVEGKNLLPPDVQDFFMMVMPDGTREFRWVLPDPPADLDGYQIKYVSGTSGTWAGMADLHTGLLKLSPYETNQLAADTYTFGIKALDRFGNESSVARIIESTIPTQRLEGRLKLRDFRLEGWPGAIGFGRIEGDRIVPNDNFFGAGRWQDLPATWAAWNTWGIDLPTLMTYTNFDTDLGSILTFTPELRVIGGGTITVKEAHKDTVPAAWSTQAAIGPSITARYLKIEITSTTPTDTGLVSAVLFINADIITEQIEDLDTSGLAACVSGTTCLTSGYRIAAGDFRAPVTESFAKIVNVGIALQNVGAGWDWEIIDKDVAVGPRIKIYDNTGTLADATIDISISGILVGNI